MEIKKKKVKGKKLRLLLVSPDLNLMGGVAETVKLLLRELEGRCEITLGVFGRRVNQTGASRWLMPFADLFHFFSLLWNNKFDVIHMNPSLNFRSVVKELPLFILFCLLGYSGKILIFVHGWEQPFFERLASGVLTGRILRLVLKRVGYVLVLAGNFKASLVNAGADSDKVKIITTMVNMDDIPVPSSDDKSCRTLLYLSRMIKEKGVYEIVEAFDFLSRDYENLKLIMAGDGPERQSLIALAESRGLKGISFPGYIQGSEKFEVLKESCVFLLPTRYGEGCPVALLEAMAAGAVPVVADAGGITDVIDPGRTAILLDSVNKESIADAVAELLDDSGLRNKISSSARTQALDNFSSEKVTDYIFDLYSRVKINKI